MPKSQFICPKSSRKAGFIEFQPIPLNQYNKTIKDELSRYNADDLVRIQRDMVVCRTFENMLNEIKLRSLYNGIEYSHNGPAHLSIGPLAEAVGQAFHLGVEAHIYC